jgi:hypothetical protein
MSDRPIHADLGASFLAKLLSAISETLKNRKTNISPDSFAQIIKLVDDSDIQVRWRYI